jgi:hypothetical protein
MLLSFQGWVVYHMVQGGHRYRYRLTKALFSKQFHREWGKQPISKGQSEDNFWN